ncbi:hypothetical protein DFH06DRAFT_1150117, partial [Mycena polygramma]
QVLAVNLGKNKDSPAESIDDFVAGVRTFAPYSDVLVVNARDQLPASSRKPKLVLKIAPDLTEAQLVEMAQVLENTSIDGVIVSNTTTQRPSDLVDQRISLLAFLSLVVEVSLLEQTPSNTQGWASLVQVYTGFGYDGAGACRRIKDELVDELAKEGSTWAEVVGKAVSQLSLPANAGSRKAQDATNPTLHQLVVEAEELKRMIEQFEQKEGE